MSSENWKDEMTPYATDNIQNTKIYSENDFCHLHFKRAGGKKSMGKSGKYRIRNSQKV